MQNPKLGAKRTFLSFAFVSSLLVLCTTFTILSQTTNYDFNILLDTPVYTMALQPDGRILVGSLSGPLRLNTNGTTDAGFDPRLTNRFFRGTCYTVGVQDDGKILVGGDFNSVSGQSHTNLGRFNADGSLDNAFKVGTDYAVLSQAFDGSGRKLVGAHIQGVGGLPYSDLSRLDQNDVPDASFNPVRGTFFSLAVQSDDRILVGGYFSSLAGQSKTNIGRLNTDGTLDMSFSPVGIIDPVGCFAGQADGKIVVATTVTSASGSITNLVRFSSTGELDGGFNPAPDRPVVSMAVQTDGKIIVGGVFTNLGGQPRVGLGRVNADGSLDTNFVPTAYKTVYSLALQDDGKILVGGTMVDGIGNTTNYIGRLQNTSAATQSLTCDGLTITWMRGGTSPEVWRTRFQNSSDGIVWTDLGNGTRISGGWQLTNVVVLPGTIIRAQGRVSAGQFNGTSWFVETRLQLPNNPRIIVNNSNFGMRSNHFGFDLTGPANSFIAIEASTDLANWIPLATNSIQSVPTYFSHSAISSNSFYRLRLVP